MALDPMPQGKVAAIPHAKEYATGLFQVDLHVAHFCVCPCTAICKDASVLGNCAKIKVLVARPRAANGGGQRVTVDAPLDIIPVYHRR